VLRLLAFRCPDALQPTAMRARCKGAQAGPSRPAQRLVGPAPCRRVRYRGSQLPLLCSLHSFVSDAFANAKAFFGKCRMSLIDGMKVVLRAWDPTLDRRRSWAVEAGIDLFGEWTARVSFGRIGSRGRTIWRVFESEKLARE